MLSESDTALSSESRKSSFTILSWFTSALHVREAKSHLPTPQGKWNRGSSLELLQLPLPKFCFSASQIE